MELDIHNITKITKSDIHHPISGGKRWRTITFTTDKGEEIEINCWAKRFSDLLIKEED